jgi:histidine ammonia-lyase
VLAIALPAAVQGSRRAPPTDALQRAVRAVVPPYADDRPLAGDVRRIRERLLGGPPPV